MDVLSGPAIAVAVLGFAVSLIGLLVVIWRVRDEPRRTVGLRTAYAGVAMMSLGGSLYVLSIPAAVLPSPLNFIGAGVFFVTFVRLAVAAALLKTSNRP
jgi:uncharacterized membrane protein